MPKKKTPKYKGKISIVGENRVRAGCSCGWTGLVMVKTESSDLSQIMVASQNELNAHKHKEK